MKFKIKQFEIVLPGMDKNKKTIGIILLMAVILFAVFYWFKYGPEKKVERPLEKITVQLVPTSLNTFKNRCLSAGSKPAVGSSTIINLGLFKSNCAIPKRCFIPPE